MKSILHPGPEWMLGLALLLGPGVGFAHPLILPPTPGETVEGTWLGALNVGGTELRIVFHISRDADGAFTATLDSPDQGATGIPVASVIVKGDSVRLEVLAVRGVYEGTCSADGATIDGVWMQGGQTFPLTLERTDEEVAPPARPQEPERPYPYAEEEVTFENAGAGVTLAGTLTTPRSGGPFPAVVLISGSGPQNRDEALMGHRPFLVLADYLTRRGLAVLRYDDRGVGQSTGAFAAATSEDFAGDALAAVAYLKGRADIDPAKIGLAGHSEGGLIAPLAAVQSPDVAYIVLMAGPGLTGEEILYAQGALILRANGVPEEAIARNRAQQAMMFDILKTEPDLAAAAQKLRAALKTQIAAMSLAEKQAQGFADLDEEALINGQVLRVNNAWFRYFLTYDPAPTLQRVTCPVLAVNGEKDLQVPPAENLSAIEAALQAGGNDAVTVVQLDGLNHLFQTAATGAPSEYAAIEETFSPQALSVIGDWILEQTER